MTNKKPTQYDWQARDITDWNANTFLAFIGDKTKELYGVDYAPGGQGAKSARWSRERGMLKQAIGKYGNAVVKRFIEICWREYRTNKPELYPYPTVTFAISYMDRYFVKAQSEIAAEKRRTSEKPTQEINYEELGEWL